jgi:hypothetical protein
MRPSFSSTKLRRRRKSQVELLEDRQLLSIITVDTAVDDATMDSTLSLREAIEISNGTLAVTSLSPQEAHLVNGTVGSTNTINFDIPKSDHGYDAKTGVWTIAVNSDLGALPAISTNAAIIDGYSQPGASKNTLEQGDNAKLVIALDGGNTTSMNGLTIDQQGSEVFGLDIENFRKAGVLITAAGDYVQVAGCFIGTDWTGETGAGNGTGVELDTSNNTIGGPSAGDRNVVSGSGSVIGSMGTDDGVYVPDQALNPLKITPTGNVIENNMIGLDATGTKAIPNGTGVNDSGSGDIYGGSTPGLGNVITGNFTGGLSTTGNVTIQGNLIGLDVTGNVFLGNGSSAAGLSGYGIDAQEAATATSISMTISDNAIAGSGTEIGIRQTEGSQSAYTISDNLIGLNAAGTAALGKGEFGLDFSDVENATVQNNIISGVQIGARLQAGTPPSELQHDMFQGNVFGVDRTGKVPLGIGSYGIEIESGSGILIGGKGPGQGNVIVNCGYDGIHMVAGQQNQFTRNSIFNNGQKGILVNDETNVSAAAPGLKFTPGSGGTGTLSGTFYSLKNSTAVIEIFSNPTNQSGEGLRFVQDLTVPTDGKNQGTFSLTLPNGFYTATTTSSIGETSEFSNVAGPSGLPATVTTVTSSANPSTVGQQVTFTAVVATPWFQGTPTGTVTFSIDGQPQSPAYLSLVGGQEEAQYVTSTLAAGLHSVTAVYSGDTNVSTSTGSLPTQTVNASTLPQSVTTLLSSANPSKAGQQVTFTAVVSAQGFQGSPTGTVIFTIDGQAQKSVSLAVVGGKDEAQFMTSTLAVGQHSVSATYSGDTNVSPSTGSLSTQIVNAPNAMATTTTVTSSLSPSTVGEQVTFTAFVSPESGSGVPTGTVTFTIDGKAQTPVSLRDVTGRELAVLSVSTLSAGKHTISATYNGDPAFAASAGSSPLVETVNEALGGPAMFDGPTVSSVERFGIHMQPTVLVLNFNDGLDPNSAQDMNNYKIVGPAGIPVAIASVSFDPKANSVTIRPKGRINIHHTYRLTVVGTGAKGVRDTDGRLLDGTNNGRPGSNYSGTLTWGNVMWTPAEAKKYLPYFLNKEKSHPSPVGHRFLSKKH